MVTTRPRRTLRIVIVSFALSAASLAFTGGFVPAQAAPTTNDPALTFPSPGASMAVWNSWAVAQKQAIQSQPYAEFAAKQGLVLQKLYFVSVTDAPGIPAGITTEAAVVIAAPAGAASAQPTGSTSVPSSSTNCSDFSNGLGSACIDAYYNSGLYWEATSELYVATDGKLNLGDGGCPGQRDVVTTGLVNVSAYETVELYYGPVNFSQTWDSRWWDDASGSYQSWGYACLTE